MGRSRVAEWILSCALPAERASAVTGDFLEEAGERGGVWFWSSVFRTLAGCVWRDIRESPRELIWLGVRGYFENFGALWWCSFCFALATLPVSWLLAWMKHEKHPVAAVWLIMPVAAGIAAHSTGRSLGRRAPDRKLAACVMFFLVYQLLPLAIGVVFWNPSSSQRPSFSLMDPFAQLVFWVALVYGALYTKSIKLAGPGV